MNTGAQSGGATWGIALIVIGTVLLLDRFRAIDIGDFWRYWPVVVIYFGLVHLVAPRHGRRSIWLLLLGVWLLISTLEVFDFDFGNSWPLLIVFVGASMLFDEWFGRRRAAFGPDGADREPDS